MPSVREQLTKINVRSRLNNNTLTDTYRRSGDKLRAFPVPTSVNFTTRQISHHCFSNKTNWAQT